MAALWFSAAIFYVFCFVLFLLICTFAVYFVTFDDTETITYKNQHHGNNAPCTPLRVGR